MLVYLALVTLSLVVPVLVLLFGMKGAAKLVDLIPKNVDHVDPEEVNKPPTPKSGPKGYMQTLLENME